MSREKVKYIWKAVSYGMGDNAGGGLIYQDYFSLVEDETPEQAYRRIDKRVSGLMYLELHRVKEQQNDEE